MYNLTLAQRIHDLIGDQPGLQEKKMFGGVGYILSGNMACGILNDDLIVRLGSEAMPEALAKAHVRPFDSYGKRMSGWVLVGPGGYAQEADLKDWIWRGVEFARSLPAK